MFNLSRNAIVIVFISTLLVQNIRESQKLREELNKELEISNEKLANLMRQMRICEERGSGIDKVIDAIEYFQLPAPKFIAEDDFFKVILFAPLNFEDMDKQDRIRATYQHCSLKFSNQECMTNTTLRKRFGLEDKQHSKASKIISDTLDKGLIKPADPENKSTRHMKYIPFYG